MVDLARKALLLRALRTPSSSAGWPAFPMRRSEREPNMCWGGLRYDFGMCAPERTRGSVVDVKGFVKLRADHTQDHA